MSSLFFRRVKPEQGLEYFEAREANPGADGICSDNECPCGIPGARIPRGTGYLYVSQATVDFRRDARSEQQAQEKARALQQQMAQKGSFIVFGQDTVAPTLMCEQGARRRGLDLEVAAADARFWWKTGRAPLRATPLRATRDTVVAPAP